MFGFTAPGTWNRTFFQQVQDNSLPVLLEGEARSQQKLIQQLQTEALNRQQSAFTVGGSAQQIFNSGLPTNGLPAPQDFQRSAPNITPTTVNANGSFPGFPTSPSAPQADIISASDSFYGNQYLIPPKTNPQPFAAPQTVPGSIPPNTTTSSPITKRAETADSSKATPPNDLKSALKAIIDLFTSLLPVLLKNKNTQPAVSQTSI